jgi:hypothetical protein
VQGPAEAAAETNTNQWENVLREIESGQVRPIYTSAPPDRALPGVHRWMSEPTAGLPAWIELRWPEPVPVREIQLIFDTGLHRFLTLSQADGYTRRMHWGAPQPETVADYVIEFDEGGTWKEWARVAGNYQRRRVHSRQESVETGALRVTVTRTHGLDHARIVEVRAY